VQTYNNNEKYNGHHWPTQQKHLNVISTDFTFANCGYPVLLLLNNNYRHYSHFSDDTV